MNVVLRLVNLPAFVQGLLEAQTLQLRFMRSEFKRGAQRIRKRYIREQLSGPPGIEGGGLKKGKNIFTFVRGDEPKNLSASIGISRILRVHEEGATITPKHGALLYLREKKGTAGERIIATAARVVIPARTHFRELVRSSAPDVLRKVAEAGLRASQIAMSKHLKRAVGL